MQKNGFRWSAAEMGSLKRRGGPDQDTDKLEIEDVSSDDPNVKGLTCRFFLHYSFIKPSDPNNPTPKNIIFIQGGPGTISELEDVDSLKHGEVNALELLEADGHNVAYLHVRGSGLSQIPEPNKFDRFLRADYVVEDIEKLRVKLLGNDIPWDAIWGESHGAVIAQRYAYKYGTAGVKKLVLVAPPSRSLESHTHRRSLMITNLEAIIRNHTGRAPQNGSNKPPNHNETDSICDLSFVTDQRIEEIKSKLNQVLENLDRRYASMSFAMENYAELKKRDASFKSFQYPEEFFKALRILQFYGRPAKNLKFPRAEQPRFNAALLLAHYLTLPEKQLNTRGDRRATLGRNSSIARGLSQDRRSVYEQRLQQAQAELSKNGPTKSRRAHYVLGVYDGISRWILDVMDRQIENDGFFRSEDIQRSVKGPVAKDLAKKIGVVPGEPIYPWNAGYYKHNVATLIIKGDADAVIAGGQAENFFNDGLANKLESILMEFPGMGHLWRESMPMAPFRGEQKPGFEVLQILVREFLAKPSASTFLHDPDVKALINSIGISVLRKSRDGKLADLKSEQPIFLEKTKKELWDMIMRLRRRVVGPSLEKNRKSYAKAQRRKIVASANNIGR
jgi:pimeloyl-ACP methyl ester carboxylesterase